MRIRTAVVVSMLLGGAPLAAHHWLSASFDATRPFTMTGVVTAFAWTNPHVAVRFDVRDGRTDAVTNWLLDMGSPASLAPLGWSRSALKPGDTIVVEGIPSRDGMPVGYAYAVTVAATGKRLQAAPPRER